MVVMEVRLKWKYQLIFFTVLLFPAPPALQPHSMQSSNPWFATQVRRKSIW